MHPLDHMLSQRKTHSIKGIPSICTANPRVIKACLREYKKTSLPLLIEATANQVNQFGGYTQMKPQDFFAFVTNMAQEEHFPLDQLILGGDHLGPLVWAHESAKEAMDKACELVRDFVLAGFTKIHLDTSMRLGDDPMDEALSDEIIAQRGAVLMLEAEEAFRLRLKKIPDALQPVYIIGSEVPIPGGAQHEETLEVTHREAFLKTVSVYRETLQKHQLQDVWSRILGVVVQPGVEFGDDAIHDYNPEKACDLVQSLDEVPSLIFEGHSTDYQTPHALKQMVRDGIAILKVGPELTFALREGLFALEAMEQALVSSNPSHFSTVLDQVMLEHPTTWQKHYHGTDQEIAFKRAYSYSDRSRYVLLETRVEASIQELFKNTQMCPMPLISQWMPIQYSKIRMNRLSMDPESLVLDWVSEVLWKYIDACMEGA